MLKDLVLTFIESSIHTEISLFQVHYVISASKQSLMLENFACTILMVQTCSPAQTMGMAAASSTETSVSIHHLMWRYSQQNQIFFITAVQSSNSAHLIISCGVRYIHTFRLYVRESVFVLWGPAVYTSNSTWGRNFFDSVTFSTKERENPRWKILQSFKELEKQGHTLRIIQPLIDYKRIYLCPVTNEIN